MARSIEEKVTKLTLDNKDLVSKAQESTKVFTKLKEVFSKADTLETGKSQKALSDLNSATKNVGMDALKSSIDGVSSKFSAFGVMAATVISNVTSKVMGFATNLASQFSLQPLQDGFAEYELKMGSIQTILANTSRHGTELKEVTDNLDELNTYADKTIYNFGDMTRNIGLFTNAGIKVGDATQMIKGFSNEAATSGTNAQQASGAAYQLSQALSAGTIRLMDWRSLQNVGMGNKNMQSGLIEIAQAMGKFTEETTSAEAASSDFNGSLESKWLTADVMENYLKIQAEGNAEVNREMMTNLGLSEQQIDNFIKQQKTAEEAATKVRTFSQLVDTAKEAMGSGWTETWELIFGDFNEATEMWTKTNNVLDGMISKSSKARNAFVSELVKIGGKEIAIQGISYAFTSLFKIIETVTKAFHNVFPPITTKQAMLLIVHLRNLAQQLMTNEKFFKNLETIMTGVFSIFSIGIKVIKMLGTAIVDMIPKGTGDGIIDFIANIAKMITEFDKGLTPTNAFSEALRVVSGVINDVLTALGKFWKSLGSMWEKLPQLGNKIKEVFQSIKDTFSKMGDKMGNPFKGLGATDFLNAGFLTTLLLFVKQIKKAVGDMGGFMDKFKDMFDNIGDGFEKLTGLTDVLSSMQQVLNVATIAAIAGSVLLLAISLNMLSKIPTKDLFKSLQVVTASLAAMMGALFIMSKIDTKGTMGAAISIGIIAGAIMSLSLSLKILSTLSPEQLGSSLFALATMLTLMVAALGVMSKINGKVLANSIAIGILAGSIIVLSAAVAILGYMDEKAVTQGLKSLGLLLLEIAAFVILTNKSKLNPATAISVAIVANAILVMVGAVALLGYMDTKMVEQGLKALGMLMLEIAAFILIVNGKGGMSMMATATSMAILAGAINLMIVPVTTMGKMSLEEIGRGLIGLGGGLAIIVAALKLAEGSLMGAAALGIAATAVAIFVPPLMLLGSMSLEQIGLALLALGGTFAIVAAAAMLMGPASLALIPFALAIGAVGLAVGAVALTLLAATTALTLLASLTVTSIASMVISLGLLIDGLIETVPKFVQLGIAIISGFLDGIITLFPKVMETIVMFIDTILTTVDTHLPGFIDKGVSIILSLLKGIEDHSGELIDGGVKAIVALIEGMATAIEDNQETMITALLHLVGSVLQLIVTALEEVVVTMFGWIPGVEGAARDLGDSARQGLKDRFNRDTAKGDADDATGAFSSGVSGGWGDAKDAGEKVGQAVTDGLQTADGKTPADDLGAAFTGGIAGQWDGAKNAGTELGEGGIFGLESVDATSSGEWFGSGFISGIEGMWESAKGAASSLGRKAKEGLDGFLEIFSPSRKARWSGGHFGGGLVLGMRDQEGAVEKEGQRLGRTAFESTQGVLDAQYLQILDMIDLNPIIKPLLDLSNITRAKLPDLNGLVSYISGGPSQQPTQGDGTVVENTYNLSMNPQGELPRETIYRMANDFQDAITEITEREKFSLGGITP